MRLTVLAAAIVVAAFLVAPSAQAAPMCEPPTIAGDARAGGQLTGTPGDCDGLIATSTTLQWFRCSGDTPESCANRPLGEPQRGSASYQPVAADAGSRLMLEQVGRDLTGSDIDRVFTAVVEGPPVAAFTATPSAAVVGQTVTFSSSSRDPDGDPLAHGWDLDGDGQFDDGDQPTAARAFGAAGAFPVALRVSAGGEESTAFTTLTVAPTRRPAARRRRALRLLSPFPVVTIAGRLSDRGALVTLLRVRAPLRSTVAVRCRGRGCPRRAWRGRVGRSRSLRVRRFERALPAGVALELRITRADAIGKFTRFRIRKGRPPARTDRCLRPDRARPVRCPR